MESFEVSLILAVVAIILFVLLLFKMFEMYIVRSMKADKYQKKMMRAQETSSQEMQHPLPKLDAKRPSIFSMEVANETTGSLSAY